MTEMIKSGNNFHSVIQYVVSERNSITYQIFGLSLQRILFYCEPKLENHNQRELEESVLNQRTGILAAIDIKSRCPHHKYCFIALELKASRHHFY